MILGSTYTGHYEPVEEISDILDEFEKETGNDIPIHVDGASGAFIAPFTYAKAGKKWNFELPRVKSINTSGHKFGLVYAVCISRNLLILNADLIIGCWMDHLERRELLTQALDLRVTLSWWNRGVVHSELFPAWSSNYCAVLQPHPSWFHWLP